MKIACLVVLTWLAAAGASGQSRLPDPDGSRGKALLAEYDAIRQKYVELNAKRLELDGRREALSDYVKVLEGSKSIADMRVANLFNRESIRLAAYTVELHQYGLALLERLSELSEALDQYLEDVGYMRI